MYTSAGYITTSTCHDEFLSELRWNEKIIISIYSYFAIKLRIYRSIVMHKTYNNFIFKGSWNC